MKKLIGILLGLSIISMSYAVDHANPEVAKVIRNQLSKTLPELTIDEVNNFVIPNVYEVVSGHKVFYVDSSGRYAILGNIVDLSTKQSLTEARTKSLEFVNWKDLPTNIALTRVLGTGKRRLAVFTDPDCPFCKRLDADIIAKQKDVTVYYFLYPLSIHADALNDSKRIICSETPELTLLNWMTLNQPLPVQNKCRRLKDLDKMREVADKIVGVDATPTLILPNGQIVSGLVPADYLAKLLTDTSTPENENQAIVVPTTRATESAHSNILK